MSNTYVTCAAMAISLACSAPTFAQGHDHGKHAPGHAATEHSRTPSGSHGGIVRITKEFHLEVAFHRDTVLVYAYDGTGAPVDPKKVKGSVSIRFKDKKRKPIEAKLSYVESSKHGKHEAKELAGHAHKHGDEAKPQHRKYPEVGHLAAALNLSKTLEGEAEATIDLSSLPGKSEKTARLEESFRIARRTEFVCPMKCVKAQHEAGDCPKCGMDLKPVEFVYMCPMHPKVTERDPSKKCWKCGMNLVKQDEVPASTKKSEKRHDHRGHKHNK